MLGCQLTNLWDGNSQDSRTLKTPPIRYCRTSNESGKKSRHGIKSQVDVVCSAEVINCEKFFKTAGVSSFFQEVGHLSAIILESIGMTNDFAGNIGQISAYKGGHPILSPSLVSLTVSYLYSQSYSRLASPRVMVSGRCAGRRLRGPCSSMISSR